jgi:16S rRNA (cytidine1402-2'-O)-methyltransferase
LAAAGTLFVVATPIGNLEDMTLRAAATLRAVHRVYAEDTRRTRALLAHLGIAGKQMIALDANAEPREIERAAQMLAEGQDAALVTDAGMPGVSDPGAALVREATRQGVRVVPIPGASAVTAAVAASGVVTAGFRFFGFLPRAGPPRADALTEIARTSEAVVLFESPQRIAATLAELAGLSPEREAVVAREMTKMHEEFLRGTLTELARLSREWLGEITVVLGPDAEAGKPRLAGEEEIDARIDADLSLGHPVKTVAQRVAAWSGRSRREIYERAVRRKEKGSAT